MPYPSIQEPDGLIYGLEVCSFHDAEDTISDPESVVLKVERWLEAVPRAV
jgi:hypothetical protein